MTYLLFRKLIMLHILLKRNELKYLDHDDNYLIKNLKYFLISSFFYKDVIFNINHCGRVGERLKPVVC